MAEELTYKRLRDLAREEKLQPGLVTLPAEFTASIETFLSSKFSDMESTRSVMQMHEFENSVAVIKEICAVRQQKILFKAIRSGGTHANTDQMTREEHELYDRFCAVLDDSKGDLNRMLARYGSGKAKPAQPPQQQGKGQQTPQNPPSAGSQTAEQASSLKKVRFLKEVPAYKGPNNETFGPYKQGDEGQLPQTEADWLLRGKLAEPLE